MENLHQDIKDIQEELKSKKQRFKEVVNLIKNEISEDFYYNPTDKRIFSYALMLINGQFNDWYKTEVITNHTIKKATAFKSEEYLNYFNIYNFDNSPIHRYNKKNIGFICYEKNLYFAIESYMEEMWLYYIKENNFKGSLKEFKNLCENKEINLYTLFNNFNINKCINYDNKKFSLIKFNYKPLKINNVVIFTE